MSDKTIFPSYSQETQEWREDTTFWSDFSIAERFGFKAVKDTWKRAFGEWKESVKYLVELCVVMNHKCWYWYEKGNEELSRWYADRYHESYGYAFRDGTKFSKEELSKFYDVID